MKRFLLLASLAAVAVGGVAAIPADAGAAKVKCKVKLNKPGGKKGKVKCPRNKLRGPRGPVGPQGPKGDPGTGTGTTGSAGLTKVFFAANGVAPNTTVFNTAGLNGQVSCTGDDAVFEVRTTKDDAVVSAGAISDGNPFTGAVTTVDVPTTTSSTAAAHTHDSGTYDSPGGAANDVTGNSGAAGAHSHTVNPAPFNINDTENTDYIDDRNFDVGDLLPLFPDATDNRNLVQLAYAAPDQTVTTGLLMQHDGANFGFNASIDCLVAGHIFS